MRATNERKAARTVREDGVVLRLVQREGLFDGGHGQWNEQQARAVARHHLERPDVLAVRVHKYVVMLDEGVPDGALLFEVRDDATGGQLR